LAAKIAKHGISVFVRNFCGGSNTGFKVEIEFEGNIFNYHYAQPTSYKQEGKLREMSIEDLEKLRK
jgi:hypothetical protein